MPDITNLSQYDRLDAISKTAALLLIPKLSCNAIRIEQVLHSAVKNSFGRKKFFVGILNQIINKKLLKTEYALAEDFSEDLFSGNIALYDGNFLVLESLWEGNASRTQQLVFALAHIAKEGTGYHSVYKSVLALLKISDAILKRSGITAYEFEKGSPNEVTELPDNENLEKLSKNLIFDSKSLEEIFVSKDDIQPFILSNPNNIDESAGVETTLHLYPIVQVENKFIVIPSFITHAIKRFILRELEKEKLLGQLNDTLAAQQSYGVFFLIHEKEVEKLDSYTKIPDNLSSLIYERFYETDKNKLLHVIFLRDNLKEQCNVDWGQHVCKPPLGLNDYIKNIVSDMSQSYEYVSTLLILGQVACSAVFQFEYNIDNHDMNVFFLHDFEIIAQSKDFSLLKLWKFNRQKKFLYHSGVRLINFSGDLNLYAYWLNNGYSFYPNDIDKTKPLGSMYIGTDFLLELRKDVKKRLNIHSVKSLGNLHFVVQKKTPYSFFKYYDENHIYFAVHLAYRRIFKFLIEGKKCNIWLNFARPGDKILKRLFDTYYQFMNMVSFWLDKGISVIDNLVKDDRKNIFDIDLVFEGWEDVDLTDYKRIPVNDIPVKISSDLKGNITVKINPSILNEMLVAKNKAEKGIMAPIISAIIANIRQDKTYNDSVEVWGLVEKMFGASDYARQMHSFRDDDLSYSLPTTNKEILVKDEDIAFIENNLDLSIKILDVNSITKCFNKEVESLYQDVVNSLSKFDRELFIVKCIENHNKVDFELQRWKRTTRSLLESNINYEEAHKEISEQQSEFVKVTRSSRILAEIAMCHCAVNNGIEPSITDLEMFMAKIIKILELGDISDAVKYQLIGSDSFDIRNGKLLFINNNYIKTLLAMYRNSVVEKDVDNAAANYVSLYKNHSRKIPKKESEQLLKFEQIFKKQFGCEYTLLADVAVSMSELAIQDKKTYLKFSKDELRNFIKNLNIEGVSDDNIESYIEQFTLRPRKSFEILDKKDPFYKNNNIWLFHRPLSPLFKPIFNIYDDVYIVFPRLLNMSFEHFIQHLYMAEFDRNIFVQMQDYWGDRRKELGQIFNDDVAREISSYGFYVKSNVEMSSLGAKRQQDENYLGDVDVLSYSKYHNVLFVIECKNLEKALTAREMGSQLSNFLSNSERRLERHMGRYRWIKNNKKNVLSLLKIGDEETRVIPLMLVNDIVTLKFKKDLEIPEQNIITFSELSYESLDNSVNLHKEEYYKV